MFAVGDKVVYPLHGAGVIESIEEKEILGEWQKYYVLRLLIGDMKVMVPVRSTGGQVRLRGIIEEDEVSKVIDILHSTQEEAMEDDWKIRHNNNLEKIKSGSIYRAAEVARNLSHRNHRKGLSPGERKLLDNACQLIVSELSFVQNMPLENINASIVKILEAPKE
ncbi:MAG: CarD family transcriptional regulator [bacterium]|nr:CarD family transcriptional regulator [bacterium]